MTQQNLGRKGRPPRVQEVAENRYAITVKGTAMKFKRTATGWFQLLFPARDAIQDASDVDYARAVLSRGVRE